MYNHQNNIRLHDESLRENAELRMKTEEEEELLNRATFIANSLQAQLQEQRQLQDKPIKSEIEARIIKLETELLEEKNKNKILRELLINLLQQEIEKEGEKLRRIITKLKNRLDINDSYDDLLEE